MIEITNKILIDPLKDFLTILAEFLPSLLSALVIFIFGLILGRVFKAVTIKTLRIMSADKFFDRIGIGPVLAKGGIKEAPSVLIGKIVCWLLIVLFSIIALYTLSVPSIEMLLQKFLLYLPNVFVAILIFIVGLFMSSFVETAVLIASVNAGIRFAKLLSQGVKIIVILLASTMAFEQLGIGHDTVLVSFTLIFGGIVFAISLAFGLAGKDIALKYLEKKVEGEEEKGDGIQHL